MTEAPVVHLAAYRRARHSDAVDTDAALRRLVELELTIEQCREQVSRVHRQVEELEREKQRFVVGLIAARPSLSTARTWHSRRLDQPARLLRRVVRKWDE